ncbi:hypothetical protein U9M48_044177, partial [Paspalum notatum var. saurae]
QENQRYLNYRCPFPIGFTGTIALHVPSASAPPQARTFPATTTAPTFPDTRTAAASSTVRPSTAVRPPSFPPEASSMLVLEEPNPSAPGHGSVPHPTSAPSAATQSPRSTDPRTCTPGGRRPCAPRAPAAGGPARALPTLCVCGRRPRRLLPRCLGTWLPRVQPPPSRCSSQRPPGYEGSWALHRCRGMLCMTNDDHGEVPSFDLLPEPVNLLSLWVYPNDAAEKCLQKARC